jgi:hypothetical protein
MTSHLKDKSLIEANMKFKGLLAGSISLNGHSPDVLKSGVQKYCRRGETEKALWCAVELDLFSKCGGEPIRTNNLNRLVVICSEDVGVAEPTLPIYIGKLQREWEQNRQSNNNQDKQALLKIVRMISESPKISLASDIRAVYHHGANIPSVRYDVRFNEVYDDLESLPDEAAGIWELSNEKDSEDLAPYMDGLIYHLDNGDDRAFYYMFKILDLREAKKRCCQRFRGWQPTNYKLVKAVGGRFQPEYAIWEHLFYRAKYLGYEGLKDVLDVLFDWYCHRSEPWLYLTQGMLCFLRDCDWSKTLSIPELDSEATEVVYQKNYLNPLTIDNYVYDKCTKECRKQCQDVIDLAKTKYVVVNESCHLRNDTYRDIYHHLKDLTRNKKVVKTSKRRKSMKNNSNSQIEPEEIVKELVEDPIPN